MASTPAEEELVDALVDYVEGDIYPTSEHVASAKLPNTALPALLEGVRKGQESVKADLRELSRNSAPNLDTWISQAKQLQHDIHESKVTAKHILEEGAKSYALHEKERDAASKADLLRNELDFNETLIGALEQIQIASSLLDKAKNAEAEGELVLAVQELGNAQRVTKELDGLQNSRFGGLLSRRAGQIKEGLATRLSKGWSALITPDHQLRKITIRSIVDVDGTEHNLADIVAALKELGTLETHVSRLYRELDSLIIGPRFSEAADGAVASLNIGGEDISVSGRADGHNLESLAADVKTLVSFLQERMPEAACTLLLERLLPNLLVRIVNDQLDPSVPVAVDKLVAYGPSLEHIQELATFVDSVGIEIPSDGNLSEWIERLPQNWLSRRREGALNSLRSASYGAVTQQKTAERVETQMVSSDDVMVAGEQQEDEWNEDWDDEDAAASKQEPEKPVKNDEDGEEAEGWGWGDDGDGEAKANQEASKPPEKKDEDDEDAEGWGWGGDEEAEENGESKQSVTPAKPAAPAKSAPRSNGPSKPKEVTHTEMTLRETFQITAIPDTLLDLIHAVLADASQISDPAFPIAEIRAASAALSPIPTLLLALYRATARSFYTSSPVADILIYNDASELATRLERLLLDLPEEHPLARRLPRAIESEIKSLQSFSRLAYGREMDSQRTILSDLLSATTGFESCTNPLNAREYTSAIDDVVARLREIDALWKDVLCDSARKQSLGTLLSHVTRKLVEDILELAGEPAGISEPESKQLKIYLDNVAQLADLFSVASPDGEARTLVHVYTPAWLRFVYLGEILEASLADIKFLWVEGELSLEFEADEIVELIQALFAESEHRRGAIREIRRSGRVGA